METNENGNLVIKHLGYKITIELVSTAKGKEIFLSIGGKSVKSSTCNTLQEMVETSDKIKNYISFAKNEIERNIQKRNPRTVYQKEDGACA